MADVGLAGHLFSVALRRDPWFCSQTVFRTMPSLKAKRVFKSFPAHSDNPHLLPRPKACFTVAHGVRPVGYATGRIVQATIRELDQ